MLQLLPRGASDDGREPFRAAATRSPVLPDLCSLDSDQRESPRLLERARGKLDAYFCVSERGSTFAGEALAGTTGFLATSNNFMVNATIMAHMGEDVEVLIVGSAFISGIATLTAGLFSNLPFGLVTSVGPNVFLATLVKTGIYTGRGALAISAGSGMLLTLASVTPALKLLLRAVPMYIKYGLVIGTGLLTALKGLTGLAVTDAMALDIDAILSLQGEVAVISLIVTASLLQNKVRGAILIGMLSSALAYWIISEEWPSSYIALRFIKLQAPQWEVLRNLPAWLQVLTLTLMIIISNSGAIIGSAQMANLLHEGDVPHSIIIYIVCGWSTMLSAVVGSPPVFVSMSASAGIQAGGRTGLTAVVMGMYFLLTAFFLSPLAAAIPHCALAPVLILVGVAMFHHVKDVDWGNMRQALPAFLCVVLQPFTGSVSNGIYAGISFSFLLWMTTGAFIAFLPERCKCPFSRRASTQVAGDSYAQPDP